MAPAAFVSKAEVRNWPVIGWLAARNDTIFLRRGSRGHARIINEETAAALDAGRNVAIFPEGRITDTGELYPFRPGVQRIVTRTPAPVIPMALQGLWGSFFSRKDGPAMSKPLRRGMFSRIGLNVGPAVPPEKATPAHLQEIIAGLRGDWK